MILVGLVLMAWRFLKNMSRFITAYRFWLCDRQTWACHSYQTYTVTEIVNGEIVEVVRSGLWKVFFDAGYHYRTSFRC